MATKKVVEKQIEPSFSKSQLVNSKRFFEERDLLNALLADNKTYTIDEVTNLISDFKKGKVK
ncbi:hypothetical protein [Anaerosporobacter sp.]